MILRGSDEQNKQNYNDIQNTIPVFNKKNELKKCGGNQNE